MSIQAMETPPLSIVLVINGRMASGCSGNARHVVKVRSGSSLVQPVARLVSTPTGL